MVHLPGLLCRCMVVISGIVIRRYWLRYFMEPCPSSSWIWTGCAPLRSMCVAQARRNVCELKDRKPAPWALRRTIFSAPW